MPLNHTNITVGTTATPILTLPNGAGYVAVQIYNNDSAAIYIGDSAVTTTNPTVGLRIGTTASLQLWMHGNETIYAVSAAGTATGAVAVVYSA
jgi:type 1 fimbria pilin